MEDWTRYNNIPVTPNMVQEAMTGYRSPKDKLSSLARDGQLLRLKRGLYSIPRDITGQSLSRELIANHLYGPSYVSFESALSYHGLIPERVYITKSATLKRKKAYNTPVGHFQYIHVPEGYYSIGISLQVIENSYAYMMARPEKAICDLILCTSGLRLQSLKSVAEYLLLDLRIEEESLTSFDETIIEACSREGYKKTALRFFQTFIHKINS